MNKRNADDLLKQIMEIIPAKEFLGAFNLGIEKYDAVIQGNQAISEYFQTNFRERQFSSAIFDAFDSFEWSNSQVHAEHDKQKSSRRSYLLVNECIVDIVKDGRMESKFFRSRFLLNKKPGNDGKRYLTLQYWINADHKLKKMILAVPKSRVRTISSISIYLEGR